MRRESPFALVVFLAAVFAAAQQATPPVTPPPVIAQAAAPIAYYAGPGVTAPEPLPVILANLATGHCKKVDGDAVLSAVVDAKGIPRDVFFIKPIGNDLDEMALPLVLADRFKPGTRDGAPAAVAISVIVSLRSCIMEERNEAGQKVYFLRLRAVPDQKVDLQKSPFNDATLTFNDSPEQPLTEDSIQHLDSVGSGVTAPVVLKTFEAQSSDYARKNHISGNCLISLIVDTHGMPQHLQVLKSVEPSLDQKALDAISHYQFKPALKNGITPVPVRITIEVKFQSWDTTNLDSVTR